MWTPEALSRCFFKADFDSGIIAFAVKVCGFAHHDAHADTVVLISFLATTSLPPRQLPKWRLFTVKMPKKASAIYGLTTLLLCGNHAGDDCIISLDYLRKGQAV